MFISNDNSIQFDEALFDSVFHEFDVLMNIQFSHNLCPVGFNGGRTNVESNCDFGGIPALGNKPDNFILSFGQFRYQMGVLIFFDIGHVFIEDTFSKFGADVFLA